MLSDRGYMHDAPFDVRRSATVALVVSLIVLFVLQSCLMFYAGLPLLDWCGLSLAGIKHGRVWQLITFQFMHSVPWPWHLLGNCLGLYFFGRSIEEALGRGRFLRLYFACGLLGGVLQLATTLILPGHADLPVVGASAGVCGLLAAYATLFPMREVTIFIVVFPVTLRALYLFWFVFLLAAYGTLVPFENLAHAAHLGGMLAALGFLRWEDKWVIRLSAWRKSAPAPRPPEMAAVTGAKRTPWQRAAPTKPGVLPTAEFISKEVDPILDKISAHGIHSLTERERRILEAARARMNKR